MKKMLFSIKGILTAMSAMLVLIVSLIASYETAPPADISLGAIPGNVVQGNELVVGGKTNLYFRENMIATSSNQCSILLPNATTSFVSASVQSRNVGTSMIFQNVVIARGANSWATTTLIASEEVVSAENVGIAATSSAMGLVFAPNSRINFGLDGTTTNLTSIIGDCTLEVSQF